MAAIADTAAADQPGDFVEMSWGGTMSSSYFARVDLNDGQTEDRSVPNLRIEPGAKPVERHLHLDSNALLNIRSKILAVVAEQKTRREKEDAAHKAGKMPEWPMQCPPDFDAGATFRLNGQQGHFGGPECRTTDEMEVVHAIGAAIKTAAQ
jgi:hypothetical protein